MVWTRTDSLQIRRRVFIVSVAEQTPEPHLTVLPADEAARRAQPLPSDDEMALDDVTDEEWDAFDRALAER